MDVKLTKKLKGHYWNFLVYSSPGQFSRYIREMLIDLLSTPKIRHSLLLSRFQIQFRSFFYLLVLAKGQPKNTEAEPPVRNI
jgi:hypothetical protein